MQSLALGRSSIKQKDNETNMDIYNNKFLIISVNYSIKKFGGSPYNGDRKIKQKLTWKSYITLVNTYTGHMQGPGQPFHHQ